MTNVQIFSHPEFGGVRVVELNGEAFFVGRDVAIALGYAKPENALATHVPDKYKKVTPIQGTPGGTQNMTVINEAGLYKLIFASKLPKAIDFSDWVCEEVLPSIRKTGKYSIEKTEPNLEDLSASAEMQKAGMLIRAAEHKAIPKEDQLKLLNMAVKILTGAELDFTVPKGPQVVVSLMKLPEVICCIKHGTPRQFGNIKIPFYSLIEVADQLGISPADFDRFSNNHGLKNDGYCGIWERVSTPFGEAREFIYRQNAIQKYRETVK